MGADWGPIFSGIIIAICLIIAIPFIDIEETDGTYKEEILQESFTKNIGGHTLDFNDQRGQGVNTFDSTVYDSIENWSF